MLSISNGIPNILFYPTESGGGFTDGDSLPTGGNRPFPVAEFTSLKTETVQQFGRTVMTAGQEVLRDLARDGSSQLPAAIADAFGRLQKVLEALESLPATSRLGSVGGSAATFHRDILASLIEHTTGRAQRTISVVATVCPDYEVDAQGKYLPNGALGQSEGLCCRRLFEGMLPTLEVLSNAELPLLLDLCFADIEALDPVMRAKVRLPDSPEEFLQRVDASRETAQGKIAAALSARSIRCEVQATSMLQTLSTQPLNSVDEHIASAGVTSSQVRAIVSRRMEFYFRFFEAAMRNTDPDVFCARRASADISDHLRLGQALSAKRAEGMLLSVATMSIAPLAGYLRHNNNGLPSFLVTPDY